MTSIKQLFCLQGLDLALDAIQSQKSRAEEELTARLELEQMETTLAEEQWKLSETQESHQSFRQEAEILRDRVPGLEERIYSGDLTTERELASAAQEAGHARKQLDDMEMRMLELTVVADNSRSRITSLESELEITRVDWESRQAELTQQVDELTSEEETLQVQRKDLAATVDQQELQKYDILRKRKGGTAVARWSEGFARPAACRCPLSISSEFALDAKRSSAAAVAACSGPANFSQPPSSHIFVGALPPLPIPCLIGLYFAALGPECGPGWLRF